MAIEKKKTPERRLASMRRYREKKRADPAWREAQSAYMKVYRERNKERIASLTQEWQKRESVRVRLTRKGLSPSLRRVVENHPGTCDMCGGPPDGRWLSLNIDHCHTTGRFRGLLCSSCNRGLAYLKDDPSLLQRGALYLRGKLIRGEAGPNETLAWPHQYASDVVDDTTGVPSVA